MQKREHTDRNLTEVDGWRQRGRQENGSSGVGAPLLTRETEEDRLEEETLQC